MSFCASCGTKIEDGVKFCPSCGKGISDNNVSTQNNSNDNKNVNDSANNVVKKMKSLNNTTDSTSSFDTADINASKGMSILAYFGILVLIPIFAAKNSKFARYHSNQGLVLFIVESILTVANYIIMRILRSIFPLKYTGYLAYERSGIYSLFAGLWGLVYYAVAIVLFVMFIIGISNAVKGKAKELPIIGGIKILN